MGLEYEVRKNRYDSVLFRVKKGKAEEYRQAAKELGIGFWELIKKSIEEYIANHAGKDFNLTNETLSGAEKNLIEEFRLLPANVQKSVIRLIVSMNGSAVAGGNETE